MFNAIKGDAKAARLMAGLFKDYKVFDTLPKQGFNPVLLVPTMNAEDWAKSVEEHQAKYRGNQGEERRIKFADLDRPSLRIAAGEQDRSGSAAAAKLYVNKR